MEDLSRSYLIPVILAALLLLVLFAAALRRLAALAEKRRAQALDERLHGKATASGYVFDVDGHSCRIWHNRIAVPLEIELGRTGKFAVIGPRSVWGIDQGLKYQQVCTVNKQSFVLAAESSEVYKALTAQPELKTIITVLFDINNPSAMLLHSLPAGRGKSVLRFTALPERIYGQPDKLENLVRKIVSVFEPLSIGK